MKSDNINNSLDDKDASLKKSSLEAIGSRFAIYDTFVRINKPLRRFISRHLVTSNDIDDIAHEAFLRAYEVEKSRKIDEPSAFLFRIARNLIFSEAKKKSRKITDYIEDIEYLDVLLTDDSLEDNLMAQQKVGILCEAVASLPPQCRRVFLLKKVYGMSQKEIAENMGIAVSTIEKHLSKSIRDCNTVVNQRYRQVNAPDNETENEGFGHRRGHR